MKKDERTLFLAGLVGVGAIIALISFVPCPTRTQGWYFLIALGLMAALVASQIPGVLHITLDPGASSRIKSGGAIAVFAMVVFLKPAALGATEAEMQFSNTSCQGPVPKGKELDQRALPDDLNPSKEGTIKSSESLGRPVRFIFNYPHGEYAGPRHWSQVKEGVWIETYPDGNIFSAFREIGRTTHDGCEGIVVERQDNAGFKVFIPDRDCQNMRLWWQTGPGDWNFLGKMTSVE